MVVGQSIHVKATTFFVLEGRAASWWEVYVVSRGVGGVTVVPNVMIAQSFSILWFREGEGRDSRKTHAPEGNGHSSSSFEFRLSKMYTTIYTILTVALCYLFHFKHLYPLLGGAPVKVLSEDPCNYRCLCIHTRDALWGVAVWYPTHQ